MFEKEFAFSLLKIHKLKNIIVNPSEKTIKLLKKENIPFELI